ncbi:hypothetical protein IU450_37935 [Nocardia abscessus]|uniref:hypothetical protein n=1 Tax=Nocardia abscessus TaxID=120957 RepID=UPI001892E4A4|nr:hypothetical protein [Nocardia abscessus]MBF6341617.1 hypothetical protein [Nocardia abscessus]
MPKYPPDPQRFARAAAVLADIHTSIRAVLDRAPDSPAPTDLPIPTTVEGYAEADHDLYANLWIDNGRSRHPDWLQWRHHNPEHDAIFEAVHLWRQALADALDWARYRTRPANGLDKIRDRVLRRLALNDAELPLQGDEQAIKQLVAEIGGRLTLVRARPFTAIVTYDPRRVREVEVNNALARHHLTRQHAAVLEAITDNAPPPTLDEVRDALMPPPNAPAAATPDPDSFTTYDTPPAAEPSD